jgi:hypothetical protein
MKKRAALSHPAFQYTAFLFEPLGDDRNGVPLALASVLGRMNLDPWNEAASLAAMPAAAAKQKLAALIEAMPIHSWMRPESNSLAERLIRLLPAPHAPPAPSIPTADATEPLPDVEATKRRPLLTYLLWIALICILLAAAIFG